MELMDCFKNKTVPQKTRKRGMETKGGILNGIDGIFVSLTQR